jgi:hypothetical protein
LEGGLWEYKADLVPLVVSSAWQPNMADTSAVTSPNAFFPGRQVFLTGVTGFLGKVVLEKLLREVPDVGRIFVLVRSCPKKGTAPNIRLRDEVLGTTTPPWHSELLLTEWKLTICLLQ